MFYCYAGGALADANFAYRITGDKAAAPLQVFDSNGKTYLQVRDIGKPLAVFDEDGRAIPYATEPPYLILPDVYGDLTVHYSKNHTARISSAASQKHAARQPVKADRTHGGSVWFGGSEPAAVTGRAAPPVKAARKIVSAPAVEKKKKMSGSFAVDDPANTEIRSAAVSRVSMAETSADGIKITFKPGSNKVSAAQIVAVSKVTKGGFSSYRIKHANTDTARARAAEVKGRMASLGVSGKRIFLEERLLMDESFVVLAGEKV